jgi:hypothetical protein
MLGDMDGSDTIVTGIIFKGESKKSFQVAENMIDKPLSDLSINEIKPGTQALLDFNSGHQ